MIDEIVTRMVQRLRLTRESLFSQILTRNQRIKSNLDLTLPQLRRELRGKPDLLRLIQEIYSYVESEGEVLSQTVEALALAQTDNEMALNLLHTGQIDLASIETYLNAISVYVQAEVPTIKHILGLFDLPPLQQALEEIDQKRWQEIASVVEKVKVKRG